MHVTVASLRFIQIVCGILACLALPGALNYGTFGPGTSAHLAAELFDSLAGVKMTAVHYKGAAPAITDLLGGTIQVMFTTVASAASLVQDGKLKALAVTSAARVPAFARVCRPSPRRVSRATPPRAGMGCSCRRKRLLP